MLKMALDVRWGYWCVAIMIAPAAGIVALYPTSWILGSVAFNSNAVEIGWLRMFMIVPLLAGAFIAQSNRSWILAVMLTPGLLLMLTVPDRIGAFRASQLAEFQYYPDVYDAEKVLADVGRLDQIVADGGWLFSVFPPQIPSTDKLKSLNVTAGDAKKFWQDAVAAADAAAALQTRIGQIQAENQTLQAPPQCGRGRFASRRCRVAQQTISANNAQIKSLTQQLANMQSAPTPESKYSIAVAAASDAKVEFQMLERQMLEKQAFVGAFPYILTSSLAFILLVYAAGFRSSTLVVLLVATITIGLVSSLPISLDDQIVDSILVLYPAFICIASAFVLRFLYRSFLDNRVIPERFPHGRVLNSLLITALLWLPFPIVVVAIIGFNQAVYSAVSDVIYCDVEVACGVEKSSFPVYDTDPSRDTLRDDVNAAISRQFARFEAEALGNAAIAKGNTPELVNAAIAKVMETYDRILPANIYDIFPNLRPPSMSDCIGWLYVRPTCFAKKIALEKLNDAYRGPRDKFRGNLLTKVTNIGNQVTATVAQAADALQAGVKGESEAAAAYASKAVDATFLGFNVISVGQMAVMLAVLMRAYLLALGRVLYRVPGPVFKQKVATPYLTLGHTDPISPEGDEMREYDDKCKVAYDHTPLLVKRAYSAADAVQSTLMWKSLTTRWHLRRLRNRCLFLKRVKPSSSNKRLSFSSGQGRSYVACTIPPGSRVFFDWAKFVAMSEHLELSKEITLRIGGLTLGTTMHACLTSHRREGVLILESGGKVTFFHEHGNPPVDSPFRLMAWRDDAAFKIVSPIHMANVYLDAPSLDPRPRSARGALDTGRNIPTFGIIRELCMLLRP
ncbi:MAG: hypothetical protein E5V97_06420 [Mesorhizobium sp.]|nr:MAG: hypothetical protein E5V97_06420 [Mesorhizobium sp.]